MPQNLEFMDCPGCGKRIRVNADHCHHCQRPNKGASRSKKAQVPFDDEDDQDTHMSVSGGYDPENDDFDYDEFVEKEFGKGKPEVKRWVWITACVLLIVLVLPILYALLSTLRA